jgi:hypothetical protein
MGEPRKCICGCGGLTKGGSFLPGHDARYKSHLVKEALAGGNPEAEEILRQRGWTKFLDKAREVAERPKAEPRRTKTEESEGQGSIKRLLVLKAAAKVLRATDQYARSSGARRIELVASNLEGILTLTLPDLDRSRLKDTDLEMSQADYFDWTEGEAQAVAEFLRLANV